MKYLSTYMLMGILLALSGCGDDDGISNPTNSGAGGAKSSIYAFQTNTTYDFPGLVAEASNFEAICSAAFSTYSPAVSCTHFYPFLGKTNTNGFKKFISVNNLNANDVVKLIDGTTTVATSLQSLISNGPLLKGSDTWPGWGDISWYSGVASDGGTGGNCSEYTDNTPASSMSVATNSSTFSWNFIVQTCDYYADFKFVCLCN